MQLFDTTASYKVIYIFAIYDEAHKGMLKIGESTINTDENPSNIAPNSEALNESAHKRISSYTKTAGIKYDLLHTEIAVRTIIYPDGTKAFSAFGDTTVHDVYKASKIKSVWPDGIKNNEWFELDLKTAINGIKAVKEGRKSLLSGEITSEAPPIRLRDEQKDAINQTREAFKTKDSMLWYAKMRFGKTLTALEVAKREKFRKTIIVTHRPVVGSGWQEDFHKIFKTEDQYTFEFKTPYSGGFNYDDTIDSANDAHLRKLDESGSSFIYFASIQDLRGSKRVGGTFDKNNAIYDMQWDFIIVDEAHEGTQTELGEKVVALLHKKGTKKLDLSGTPFNILNKYNDNVYTWDYVMEQKVKNEWDTHYPGVPNPYADLPKMHIYTYNLGENIPGYIDYELGGKAFNFREFFRTWTGNPEIDKSMIPSGASIGDFVHETDITSFLNLITKVDERSLYPYSTQQFRDMFKHTLWMVPGVKAAKALSKLLKKHPIFSMFAIANVAGEGDEEENYNDALIKVKDTIAKNNYTITLSCGKLTTGVTVKEWTAVFMLSGSYTTAAAGYLQTIFRVQSAGQIDGKQKENCYVFDFAPDRTLKVLAEAAHVSHKAGKGGGKSDESNREAMRDFLNFCPVISIDGTDMKPYSVERMMQELKQSYAEKAIRTGFEDTSLYNDQLLQLDEIDLKQFEKLKKIVGTSKATGAVESISINEQGFTEEEYSKAEAAKKKPPKQRTPEENELLKKAKEKKEAKDKAISILRGVSIRMPLLIYGSSADIDEDITIEKFVQMVDEESWKEFMPENVTKELFADFIKYYDQDVFVAAGKEIRNLARSADSLPPTERVKKIAHVFSFFKNPDKETVLTPWRVVNMHMGDIIGGYNFFDENYSTTIDEPRFIDNGSVTTDVFRNTNAKVLEFNSKSGLYPLYVAYSVFRSKLNGRPECDMSLVELQRVWNETVSENLFIICKTPMAKSITKRTLVGYTNNAINAKYYADLIKTLKNKPESFAKLIVRPDYWEKEGEEMKFDAIVGNPPYQMMDGGSGPSASALYDAFVVGAKKLNPAYISMITPSRWFAGGKGLDTFRDEMLNDTHLRTLFDYTNSVDCFANVDIAGGVSYFLWDESYNGNCEVTTVRGGKKTKSFRKLNEYDIFIRLNESLKIIKKVEASSNIMMDTVVLSRNPFGFSSKCRGTNKKDNEHNIKLIHSKGFGYVTLSEVLKNSELVDKWKVSIGKLVPSNGEVGVDPAKGFNAMTRPRILKPKEVITDSYLVLATFETENEANNFSDFMKLKFPRFLMHETYSSMNISRGNFRFVPFMDYSKCWTDNELYKMFNLTVEEIAFIESMIRKME